MTDNKSNHDTSQKNTQLALFSPEFDDVALRHFIKMTVERDLKKHQKQTQPLSPTETQLASSTAEALDTLRAYELLIRFIDRDIQQHWNEIEDYITTLEASGKQYLGVADIISRWCYSKQGVHNLIGSFDFPRPSGSINNNRNPYWHIGDVIAYEQSHPEVVSEALKQTKIRAYAYLATRDRE